MELKSSGQNLLEAEACILCYLKGHGIPNAKSYGYSGNYNVLVMELLGKSLEDLYQAANSKFSMKTVCMIGIQMIDRIEFIHEKHIIHRDIKPENFTIGLEGNSNMIYLIDFGLAKKFRSSKTLEHNPMKNNKKLTGTARYASINALKGLEQSRRDDLEAIGYVLMYFLRGVLPWQGMKVYKDEDRYKKIYEKKKATKPEDLCAGFPSEFTTFVEYTQKLDYEQNPDYEYLRGLFKSVLKNNGTENDLIFDWNNKAPSKKSNKLSTKNNISVDINGSKKNERNKDITMEEKNKVVQTNTNNANLHVKSFVSNNNLKVNNTNVDNETKKVNQSNANNFENSKIENVNFNNISHVPVENQNYQSKTINVQNQNQDQKIKPQAVENQTKKPEKKSNSKCCFA